MRTRSRTVAVLLTFVPGWGHVYWGREKLGLAIFTAFAVAAFALLNGMLVSMGAGKDVLVATTAALCFLVLTGAFADIITRTAPKRVAAEGRSRERSLRDGTAAYLRGELEKARECFRAMLSLDPQDVEAFFRLGIVASRDGNPREAVRWFRRLRKHDLDGKWDWEAERELARLLPGTVSGPKPETSPRRETETTPA